MWTRTRSSLAIALLALMPSVARADDDAMAPYRERFKAGYEKYRAGAFGEALSYWEAIYRELGPEQGYRLSWNIARAYDALGDATRAAERYGSFLEVVAKKRERGEAIEELVLREEEEARARLDALAASRGRIKVIAESPPVSVQIDAGEPRLGGFVAYVTPGAHLVVFAPGTKDAERRELTVAAGQQVEVTPPKKVEAPPLPPPAPRVVREVEHVTRPFGVGWVIAAGALTAASVAFPIAGYVNAQGALDGFRASQKNQDDFRRQTELADAYNAARAGAYVTLAVPLVLGAATTVLGLWWLGATRHSIVLVPQTGGATFMGRF
jgi:hypothetical protein